MNNLKWEVYPYRFVDLNSLLAKEWSRIVVLEFLLLKGECDG